MTTPDGESSMTSGAELGVQPAAPSRRSLRAQAQSQPVSRWRTRMLVVVACVLAAGLGSWGVFALVGDRQAPSATSYVVGDTTIVSSAEITEEATGAYLYLPVNTDVGDVILELDDPQATARLREQMEQIDTMVPGEHRVEIPGLAITVIVDGLDE